MTRDWRALLGLRWLPLIDEVIKSDLTEQQIAEKYGLTAQELTEFKSDEEMTIHARKMMPLIKDIADGMSYVQISQIHGISIEQIPHFSRIWAEQIDYARDDGTMANKHMELMFESAELLAEIAAKRAAKRDNDPDNDNDPENDRDLDDDNQR
jgi:hypothetical protein